MRKTLPNNKLISVNANRAGSYRRATAAGFPDSSPYLKSILNPFDGATGIPDLNMTTAYPKTVNVTDDFLIEEEGAGLFVYLPHSTLPVIRHYIWSKSLGRYYFHRTIPYDQNLSEDFTFGRFVSGGVTIRSSTTSGTAFNIAGVFNAAAFQEMPDLSELTFNQITSYKRNSIDVVMSIPVEDGVTALAHPDGDNEYVVFSTESSFRIDGVLRIWEQYRTGTIINSPWASPVTTGRVFDSSTAPGLIPKNLFGQVDVRCNIAFGAPVVGVYVMALFIVGDRIDAGGLVEEVRKVCRAEDEATGGPAVNSVSFSLNNTWDSDVPIRRIYIDLVGAAPIGSILQCSTVEIMCHQYYSEGFIGPGTLIGYQGLSQDQTLSIAGVGNFEVVPNENLSRNITTNFFSPFNPTEMEMVMAYLAAQQANGVRFVWTNKAYSLWLATGELNDMAEIENLAEASGFTDLFSTMLRFAKPMLKSSLPTLGGALAGPTGAAIGTMASSLMGEASAYSRYRGPSTL